MTLQEALDELVDSCEADKAPLLSEDTLTRCLRSSTFVQVLVPGAFYTTGARVLAPGASLTASGTLYVVTQGGACPAGIIAAGGQYLNFGIRPMGGYDGCQWDMQAAKKAAWQQKAAKLQRMVDVAQVPDRVSLSQRYQQARDMVESFGPAAAFG